MFITRTPSSESVGILSNGTSPWNALETTKSSATSNGLLSTITSSNRSSNNTIAREQPLTNFSVGSSECVLMKCLTALTSQMAWRQGRIQYVHPIVRALTDCSVREGPTIILTRNPDFA